MKPHDSRYNIWQTKVRIAAEISELGKEVTVCMYERYSASFSTQNSEFKFRKK
jgi:hypothetical protein